MYLQTLSACLPTPSPPGSQPHPNMGYLMAVSAQAHITRLSPFLSGSSWRRDMSNLPLGGRQGWHISNGEQRLLEQGLKLFAEFCCKAHRVGPQQLQNAARNGVAEDGPGYLVARNTCAHRCWRRRSLCLDLRRRPLDGRQPVESMRNHDKGIVFLASCTLCFIFPISPHHLYP